MKLYSTFPLPSMCVVEFLDALQQLRMESDFN